MKKDGTEYSIPVNNGEDAPFRTNEIIKGMGLSLMESIFEKVDNAREAKATKVKIFFKNDDGRLMIIVRDNGTGIHEEDYPNVARYGALKEEKVKAQKSGSLGQNKVGGKGAMNTLCQNGYYNTVVKGKRPVILYPQPDKVIVKTSIISDIDKSEVRQIGEHGTSVILTDLKMTREEFNQLRHDVRDQLGMYYQIHMTMGNGDRLRVWITGDDKEDKLVEIEPFIPHKSVSVDDRVSKGHDIQTLLDGEVMELIVSNELRVSPTVWMAYVPPKNVLKNEGRKDLSAKYYPKFIEDGRGVFVSRNGRLVGMFPNRRVDKGGGRMNSVRLWLDFSSKKDSFLFEKDAIKRPDVPRQLWGDLREKIDKYIVQAKEARNRAIEQMGIKQGNNRKITIGMAKTAIERMLKNIVLENPKMEIDPEQFINEFGETLSHIQKADPKIVKPKKTKRKELVHA